MTYNFILCVLILVFVLTFSSLARIIWLFRLGSFSGYLRLIVVFLVHLLIYVSVFLFRYYALGIRAPSMTMSAWGSLLWFHVVVMVVFVLAVDWRRGSNE
jgi:hypothetical protein